MSYRVFFHFICFVCLFGGTSLFAQDFFGFGMDGEDDGDDIGSFFGGDTTPTPTPDPVPVDFGNARPAPAPVAAKSEAELILGLPSDPAEPLTSAKELEILEQSEAAFFESRPMSPIEMYQSAVVLSQHKGLKNVFSARMFEISELYLSNAEEYEIVERIGTKALLELKTVDGIGTRGEIIDKLLEGAQMYISNRPSLEKILLREEPKSPLEIMESLAIINGAGRLEVANSLLNSIRKQFDAEKVSDAECVAILEKLGTNELYKIASNEEFVPNGYHVVGEIMKKVRKFYSSRERIDSAIDRLALKGERTTIATAKKDDRERSEAVNVIWRGGEHSVKRLLERLHESDDPELDSEIATVLVSMKATSKEALCEAFRAGSEALAIKCAEILLRILPARELPVVFSGIYREDFSEETKEKLKEIALKRYSRLLEPEEAAAELYKLAIALHERETLPEIYVFDDFEDFSEEFSEETDETAEPIANGLSIVWDWNGSEMNFHKIPLLDAARRLSHLSARDAFRTFPKNRQIGKLYLEAFFERIVNENGLDNRIDTESNPLIVSEKEYLDALFPEVSPESVLLDCMNTDHSPAGITAVAFISARKSKPDELLSVPKNSDPGKRYAPIVRALSSRDPRVRFAALECIMDSDPQSSFPGSSMVLESLMYFARSTGDRKIVIGGRIQSESMRILGSLYPRGYIGHTAYKNREVMRHANSNPDTELVIIDSACTDPDFRTFVQDMRCDIRTAMTPIAIMTDDMNLLRKDSSSIPYPLLPKSQLGIFNPDFEHSLSVVFVYPVSEDDIERMVDKLIFMTGTKRVPEGIRLENARKSIDWITRILQRQMEPKSEKAFHFENLDGFAFDTLYSGVHTNRGLELAACVHSMDCQAGIVNVIMQNIYPMETRKHALVCYEKSLEINGPLLRGSRITQMYDRYNASEFESKEIQELLGKMLDHLETAVQK